MYTIRQILGTTLGLTMSGVKHDGNAVNSSPNETPEQALTKKLRAIKDDAQKTDAQKTDAQKTLLLTVFPGNLSAQLRAVHANNGAGNPISGEGISLRLALVEAAKTQNSKDYEAMIAELDIIIKLDDQDTKSQAENLKKELVTAKTNYETGVAVTKKVTETQTSNLNREKYFADKNVSWTGLLSVIKMEQGKLSGPDKSSKAALASLMTKFDGKGWEASRETNKDDALLADLQKAGYLRFSGTAGSLEYGHKVVAALREIQKDWKDYEKVINGTEALSADKFTVPNSGEFASWKGDNQKIANFLADVSGDGILSQTNQVSRMGFLGIFGREDMNKKQLSELGAAKLLQDELSKPNTDFWTKLGVTKPTKVEEIEGARRALFLRVALADGNPDILRDPALANKVINRQIQEQTKQLETTNKARLEAVTKALAVQNKELPPELLDQAGKSLLTAVDVGGLLVGTGVSLEELARNTKIDADNPKVFTLLTAGKKWEKQLSKNLQGHLGVGGGAGVDSNGAFFAGAGVDAGIKLTMQDNGKLGVTKGNQTLELNAGVGTSLLGFVPVGTVELAYRWNDVISALQSSDANTRNFLKGLFQTDKKGNITMVDASTKTDAIKALVGDDKYGEQDIKMAMSIIDTQLKNSELKPTEKVVAVQNFIENFARYNEIRNYQAKQGFHLAGVGFGVLAGPAVLAPFVRLIGQNIQAGYRVDAEKTQSVAKTKADITLSPEALAKAPDSKDLLTKRGVTMTKDGRGIDVSQARFAEIKIVGDEKKIEPKNNIYTPVSGDERLVSIVQTSRDMNGAETYALILTTVPADNKTETTTEDKKEKNTETFSQEEKTVLDKLVSIGSLPDTLKGDRKTLRQKYPVMESANDTMADGSYKTELSAMQSTVRSMMGDNELMKLLSPKISITEQNISNNPAFLRAFLGTILALTSGSVKSRELGTRIGASNKATTADEVNKYLETKGLITAELAALKTEYPGLNMAEKDLKELMKFKNGANVTAGKIPDNMYAESAYAKAGQNGTAALPPGARIAGDIQPYGNDVIRKALIAKLEVPKNLAGKGFTKANYAALLESGTVSVTKDGKATEYTAEKSTLKFARSAVTTDRTCFNAVFAITVPTEVKWTDNTVKAVSSGVGGLDIGTDTLLSGATKAAEASTIFVGSNQRKSRKEEEPTPPGPGPDPTPGSSSSSTTPSAPSNPAPRPAPTLPTNPKPKD